MKEMRGGQGRGRGVRVCVWGWREWQIYVHQWYTLFFKIKFQAQFYDSSHKNIPQKLPKKMDIILTENMVIKSANFDKNNDRHSYSLHGITTQ